MSNEKKLTGYPSIDKPWLKYYSDEAINAELPKCTIYEYLYENNKDYPMDIAINYLGRKLTYKTLFTFIDKTASAFLALGVKEQDIVTVALPSIPEAIYCVYALNKIGAVANMIHPLAGREEIMHYLNEVESKVAIIFDGTYDIMGDAIKQTTVKDAVVVSAGCSLPFGIKQLYSLKNGKKSFSENEPYLLWKDFLKKGQGETITTVEKSCYDLALISHTGGTTGEPKGVMCSDYNINALVWQLGALLPYKRQEICLAVLPPFINYSLVDGMIGILDLGIQVVLVPEYIPEEFDYYVKKYQPNYISSIPAYWEAILGVKNRKTDWSCLKKIFYGGEAMDTTKEKAVNKILQEHGSKTILQKGLGATELVSAATMTNDNCNIIGSVGIPFVRVNCKIVRIETTEELSYETEGEICFSGATVMMGYYHKQEETDKIIKIHKDGERWLHTGDIGYIDKDGVLFLTGRIKRIISTRNAKMFPDRIEKAIYTHSAVELCCVVGVPDEVRINYPKAFIVLKNGYIKSDEVTESILEVCSKLLPEYMIPTEIEYCDDLPRTERGKVDYRKLEQQELDRNQ